MHMAKKPGEHEDCLVCKYLPSLSFPSRRIASKGPQWARKDMLACREEDFVRRFGTRAGQEVERNESRKGPEIVREGGEERTP